MKIALIIENEAYFWVLDESGRTWQSFIENGDSPALRMSTWDCYDVDQIHEHIAGLITEHHNALAAR